MIVVVDYGMGNVGSIASMLRRCDADARVTSEPAAIESATKLILPGVGAFDAGMIALRERGIESLLARKVFEERIPVLGICLGMQLMAHRSEEGREAGLGWIDADCVRFRPADMDAPRKIPHMGWNDVVGSDLPGFDDSETPRFYFVHSFHLKCANDGDVAGRTTYGYEFASVVRRDNVVGVQFHPEKSHRYGQRLLHWFATR